MATTVHVVLHKPNGDLLHRTGIHAACRSACQLVAVFVERSEDKNGAPGPWWDEYSGRAMFAAVENPDGCAIWSHDTTPTSSTVRQFNNDHSVEPGRSVQNNLADAIMGQGACWDVLNDGDSSYYDQKLAEARTLVGAPT
jgi:hypothetical protein